MSTPQQPARTPRRSAKNKQQYHNISTGHQAKIVYSDNDSSQNQDSTNEIDGAGGNQKNRRRSQAQKKNTGSNNYPSGTHTDRSSTTTSQPQKTQATPIKQAYAGPTFHHSPAASALPLPSFYSKSVPNVVPAALRSKGTDINADLSDSNLPNKESPPNKRESTPLDFLFEAARQARGTPRAESPATRSGNRSMLADSPISRSPGPRDPESVFPFELDGASTPGEDGTAFATPYKERLDALKSVRPTSNGIQNMDENERKAKTEALKRFLMQPQNSMNPPPVQQNFEADNPFNARAPGPQGHLIAPVPQTRHRSNPSTPAYMPNYLGQGGHGQYFPTTQYGPNNGPNYMSPPRPPSSNLRNVYGAAYDTDPAELSSDNTMSTPHVSTARRQPSHSNPPLPQTNLGQHVTPPRYNQPTVARATPTAQQLEDDLRRVLKLDLTSQG